MKSWAFYSISIAFATICFANDITSQSDLEFQAHYFFHKAIFPVDTMDSKHDAAFKTSLFCEMKAVSGCEKVCSSKQNFPGKYVETAEINGQSVTDFLFNQYQKIPYQLEEQIRNYNLHLQDVKDIVVALSSQNSCEKYMTSNAPRVFAMDTHNFPNSRTADEKQAAQLLEKNAAAFQKCKNEENLMLLINDKYCDKYQSGQDFKAASQKVQMADARIKCQKLIQDKGLFLEDQIKRDLAKKRRAIQSNLNRAFTWMSPEQLQEHFGSYYEGSAQNDLFRQYVVNSATEALFINCINVSDTATCLNQNVEKFNKLQANKNAKEVSDILKKSPELANYNKSMNEFTASLNQAKRKPLQSRVEEALPCLKDQISKSNAFRMAPASRSPARTGQDARK